MRRRTLLSASSGGIDIDPTTGRGTIGSYEVVDLGLSNGLLFAACNVGAIIETSIGDYYMYGKGSRKYNSSDSIYEGMENPLASSADTATRVMGEGWRMPTRAEFLDLIYETNYNFETIGGGVYGGKFTSKVNPNAYVFFPAAGLIDEDISANVGGFGYYWSSTPDNNASDPYSYFLNLTTGGAGMQTYVRHYGYSVRGVHAKI